MTIKNPIICIITYNNNNSLSVTKETEMLETREAAISWARSKLNTLQSYDSSRNTFRVFIGETQEEYKAEKTWSFTPINVAPTVAKAGLSHAETAGIEI